MNKTQTNSVAGNELHQKPRRLGRGLSAMLGEPVAVQVAPVSVPAIVEPKSPSGTAGVVGQASSSRNEPARSDSSGTRIVQLALESAEPNRFQPRRTFDEAQLKE